LEISHLIKDKEILEEVFDQIVHNQVNSKRVDVVKRKFYTIIYFDLDLPDNDPENLLKEIELSDPGYAKLQERFGKMTKTGSVKAQYRKMKQEHNFFKLLNTEEIQKVRDFLIFLE
jgi:hypothetical protein